MTGRGPLLGERQWPFTVAILAMIAVPLLLPSRLTIGPNWLVPAVDGIFLIAILALDRVSVVRPERALRRLAIGLALILIIGAGASTAILTHDLITGGPETNSANALLASGFLVWINNNITFAFLYWLLDSGGPFDRERRTREFPDFAFPQQLTPSIAPAGWRPVFGDYLYLGFTNATAFSPTDVMPVAHWPKLAMTFQSVISLVLLSLVIARAVNVLS